MPHNSTYIEKQQGHHSMFMEILRENFMKYLNIHTDRKYTKKRKNK